MNTLQKPVQDCTQKQTLTESANLKINNFQKLSSLQQGMIYNNFAKASVDPSMLGPNNREALQHITKKTFNKKDWGIDSNAFSTNNPISSKLRESSKVYEKFNSHRSQLNTENPSRKPEISDITICSAPLKIAGIQVPLLRHFWLKTPHMSAGLGPATGEIPLINGNLNPPGVNTAWIDHSAAHNTNADIRETPYSETVLLQHLLGPINIEKLEKNIQKEIGKPQGAYLFPPTNNCVTAAFRMLNESKSDTSDK